MSQRTLPEGVQPYHRTPEFTRETLPEGLRTVHRTKPYVWGVIHVMVGQLAYHLEGHEEPLAIVHPGETFVVLPGEAHLVQLSDDAGFYVEFHKDPSPTA